MHWKGNRIEFIFTQISIEVPRKIDISIGFGGALFARSRIHVHQSLPPLLLLPQLVADKNTSHPCARSSPKVGNLIIDFTARARRRDSISKDRMQPFQLFHFICHRDSIRLRNLLHIPFTFTLQSKSMLVSENYFFHFSIQFHIERASTGGDIDRITSMKVRRGMRPTHIEKINRTFHVGMFLCNN